MYGALSPDVRRKVIPHLTQAMTTREKSKVEGRSKAIFKSLI